MKYFFTALRYRVIFKLQEGKNHSKKKDAGIETGKNQVLKKNSQGGELKSDLKSKDNQRYTLYGNQTLNN